MPTDTPLLYSKTLEYKGTHFYKVCSKTKTVVATGRSKPGKNKNGSDLCSNDSMETSIYFFC